MMELLLVREALALLGAMIAAYTDWKTGFIYDWLTYPLIALGLLSNVLNFNPWNLLPAALVFAGGYLMYYMGKIGGGDVKLFTALSLLVPYQSSLPFVLPVLLIAAVAAMTWIGAYYVVAYVRKGIEWEENRACLRRGLLLVGVMLAYFIVLSKAGFLRGSQLALLAVPLVFAVGFVSFEHGIRKTFFLHRVKPAELEEDEVLALEFLDAGLQEKLGKSFKGIVDEAAKRKLQEAGGNEIPVYRNLPKFGPFILLGVLATLYWPTLFEWLTGVAL